VSECDRETSTMTGPWPTKSCRNMGRGDVSHYLTFPSIYVHSLTHPLTHSLTHSDFLSTEIRGDVPQHKNAIYNTLTIAI
jgi:hypothetical protein